MCRASRTTVLQQSLHSGVRDDVAARNRRSRRPDSGHEPPSCRTCRSSRASVLVSRILQFPLPYLRWPPSTPAPSSPILPRPAPLGIVKIWDFAPYTAPVVWGKPLPGSADRGAGAPGARPPVSPTRISSPPAVVAVADLGPRRRGGPRPQSRRGARWPPRVGRSRPLRPGAAPPGRGHAPRRRPGRDRLDRSRQQGAVRDAGPARRPTLVRWCGTTYRPNGVVSSQSVDRARARPRPGLLRLPVGLRRLRRRAWARSSSCATSGPLFVDLGPSHYAAYDAGRPSRPGLARPRVTPPFRRPRCRHGGRDCVAARGWPGRAPPCAGAPNGATPRRTRPRR